MYSRIPTCLQLFIDTRLDVEMFVQDTLMYLLEKIFNGHGPAGGQGGGQGVQADDILGIRVQNTTHNTMCI